ncbi:MAG: ABC transporter permease [Chlamydiales bacterium]
MLKSNLSKSKYASYLVTVYYLILRDLRVFREEFWGKFIDTALLLFTTVIIFGYFLPAYGLKADYGPFLLVGVIAGFGFFEVMGRVSLMIADMEGDRTILYTLSLPIPARLVFVYLAVSWGVISSIMSILMFPLGKLLLYNKFHLSHISPLKLLLIFIMSNLFFGFFALWLSAVLKKMSNLSHLFVRVINPMYSFGGWWYSWYTISNLSPLLGYAHFINPLLYVMEGMRAAILGQEGYLPFWFSFLALTAFTWLVGWDAIRRLQKRLDCVTT